MTTEISRLEETKHLFELFHLKPFDFMLEEFVAMFKTQVSDTILIDFVAVSNPQWITTEKIDNKAKDDGVYTRAGVAIECVFTLKSKTNEVKMSGILTWAVVNLVTKPIRQMWFDKDGTLEEFGEEGELKTRLYSVHNFA